jgi:hypothetical protein
MGQGKSERRRTLWGSSFAYGLFLTKQELPSLDFPLVLRRNFRIFISSILFVRYSGNFEPDVRRREANHSGSYTASPSFLCSSQTEATVPEVLIPWVHRFYFSNWFIFLWFLEWSVFAFQQIYASEWNVTMQFFEKMDQRREIVMLTLYFSNFFLSKIRLF